MKISALNQSHNYQCISNFKGNKTKQMTDAAFKYGPTAVIEAGKIAYPIVGLLHTNQLNIDNFILFYALNKIVILDMGEYCLKYIATKNNAPDNYYAWSKLNIWAQYRKSKYCKAFANQLQIIDSRLSSLLKNKENK